eukprot:TRINITY_DN9360_c2_g1_i1.p1 TRINITY_DN9360_c2_g1~~TRINITY_DN9360_c2_g1_i1.p1  ORF type:complete len:946 (-),score=88.95 TRINITY_DN9360_c2_g1_i1:332-2878(-)
MANTLKHASSPKRKTQKKLTISRFADAFAGSSSEASSAKDVSPQRRSSRDHSFERMERLSSVGLQLSLSSSASYKAPSVHHVFARVASDDFEVYNAGLLKANSGYQHQRSGWHDRIEEGYRFGMLHPNSNIRVLFDVLGIVVLIIELSLTPFSIAWDLPAIFLQYVTWCTLVFWSMDMISNFRTGYFDHGTLEMRPGSVARHYLRSFFLPDLFLISIDIMGVIVLAVVDDSNASSQAIMLSRFAKANRGLRLFKVLRVSHMFDRITKLKDTFFTSHSSRLVIELLSMYSIVVWINHVVACGWYALTQNWRSDTGTHWLDLALSSGSSDTYADLGMVYQYTTSFHWALTQMTPGSMQVFPVNSMERIYNVMVLLFGMFVFSSIISSISSKMMQYKLSSRVKVVTMQELRKFMMQNKVRTELAVQIQKQVKENLNADKKLVMKDLDGIKLLNASLREQLQAEILDPYLGSHRVLIICTWINPFLARRLSRDQVIDANWFSRGNVLFSAGSEASGLYHVISGKVLYTRDAVDDEFDSLSWFCDTTLFLPWRHVGSLTSDTESEILKICTTRFLDALQHLPIICKFLCAFAQSLAKIFSSMPAFSKVIDDVALPDHVVDDAFRALDGSCQVFVALTCAERWRTSSMAWAKIFRSRHQYEELKKEIMSHTCLVYPGANLAVQRVVALAAIRLVNDDGSVLLELGREKDGTIQTTCILPGSKTHVGETIEEALQRVLTASLAPIGPSIQIGDVEDSISFKTSHRLSITTKYLKRTYSATLSAPMKDVRRIRIRSPVGELDLFAIFHRDRWTERMSYFAWLDPEEADRLLRREAHDLAEWDSVLTFAASQAHARE